MSDQKYRLDIRIIKFQDYIRRKPGNPFGYYGLGVQYMFSGKPSQAERMFSQALKIDPEYVPAKLGRLEVLLAEKKLLSACRYYQQNAEVFRQKKLFITRIQRMTSELYRSRGFYRYTGTLKSIFVFGERFGVLRRMFDSETDNMVAAILLAMFLIKRRTEDKYACSVFKRCVGMDGINDRLRWDLMQALSKELPSIWEDPCIAGMFSTIPDGACSNRYASFLLSRFIQQQNEEKVLKAFALLYKNHIFPDRKTQWQYLYFCRTREIWNPAMFSCCQKLLASGWVDSFVASTVKELKKRGMAENSREADNLLSMYGYL